MWKELSDIYIAHTEGKKELISSVQGNPFFWHLIEVIFAPPSAIASYFLLTTLKQWTGKRLLHTLIHSHHQGTRVTFSKFYGWVTDSQPTTYLRDSSYIKRCERILPTETEKLLPGTRNSPFPPKSKISLLFTPTYFVVYILQRLNSTRPGQILEAACYENKGESSIWQKSCTLTEKQVKNSQKKRWAKSW